jgi:hypothetical protein
MTQALYAHMNNKTIKKIVCDLQRLSKVGNASYNVNWKSKIKILYDKICTTYMISYIFVKLKMQ